MDTIDFDETPEEQLLDVVLVGVDGSPGSADALRWAAGYATRAGLRLRAVTAFRTPPVTSEAGFPWEVFEMAETAARAQAAHVIELVLGADAEVEHVVESTPIDEAIEANAADAAIVVVGTRPAAWFRTYRSSLTNRLTGRLTCPVVSVPTGHPVLEASLAAAEA